MKSITLTLLLLTISLINFSQVKTSEPFKVDYLHILGKSENSLLFYEPMKKGIIIHKLDSQLKLVKSSEINLDLKQRKDKILHRRLKDNEIQLFVIQHNDKINEKRMIIYRLNASNLSLIEKKTIHKYTFPKTKYNSPISSYFIVESPDKSKLTLLLQSPIYENQTVGSILKNKITLTTIEFNEDFDLTKNKEYLISKNTSNDSFYRLTTKELTNSGKILLTYRNTQGAQELFVIDSENDNFIKTKELLKVDEILEDEFVKLLFKQVHNESIDETFIYGYTTYDTKHNIKFQLINEQSKLCNSKINLPGSDNETTKRCEFSNLHSMTPVEDGFIIVSEYALLKKGEEAKIIGGNQELKDEWAFSMSNSHLIITKLNFNGEIVWSNTIDNIRRQTQSVFYHEIIISNESAYLFYKKDILNSNVDEVKLSKINIPKGYIESKVILKENINSSKTNIKASSYNPESNTLYFQQRKGRKHTIKSVSLNNF